MSTTRRRWIKLSIGIVAGLALAVPTYGVLLWTRVDKFDAPVSGSGGDGTTWLILGSDSRASAPSSDDPRFGSVEEVPGERADIVLVVHATKGGEVSALGVPRDLTIMEKSAGFGRVGLLLSEGPGAIATALCDSFGIGIDHIALMRFSDLTRAVDLVGTVDVSADAVTVDRSSGLLLEAGVNALDGDRALAYVRARHIETFDGSSWVSDPVASAERPERALEIVRALAAKMNPSVTSPLEAHRLAWTGAALVSFDSSTGPSDARSLLTLARNLDEGDVTSLSVWMNEQGDIPLATLAEPGRVAIESFAGAGSSTCPDPALLNAG